MIGVNAQIATGSQTGEGANVGIGFAIPSSTVKQFLSDAKAGKDAPRQQQTQPDPTQEQQDPQTDPFGGGQVDPQQVDPSQVDPSQVDPQQVDPSQVDPQQVDPSQVDPSQVDPSQVDPNGGQTDPFGDQQQAAPQQQADPFGGLAG